MFSKRQSKEALKIKMRDYFNLEIMVVFFKQISQGFLKDDYAIQATIEDNDVHVGKTRGEAK